MRRISMLGIILATLLMSLSFGTKLVQAAGDMVMSVQPSHQILELTPGKKYTGSLEVSNPGSSAFMVKTSVRPFYVNDTYELDFAAESAYTKITNWIKLAETEFELAPGATHKLEFTVQVPEDVASGGQYAAIMLLNDSGDTEGASVNVSGQIAALLYGHVNGGELRMEGELLERSMPQSIISSDFYISQAVRNTGNVDFRVEQTLTVKDFFSNREIVNSGSVDKDGVLIGSQNSVVLPGTTRTGILKWNDAPKLGLFQVTQTVKFLDQNFSETKIVFICPLWLIVVVIALIIVLILWIIRKIYCKLRQSSRDEDRDIL